MALRTEWVRSWFTGGVAQVSIATLSQARLGDLPMPLPDVAEQAQIVKKSLRDQAEYENLRRLLERQTALLVEHRHALIRSAVAIRAETEAA